MVSNVTRGLWSRQITSFFRVYANGFSPHGLCNLSGKGCLHIDVLEVPTPDRGITWASLSFLWLGRDWVVMVTGLGIAFTGRLDVGHFEVLGKATQVAVSLFCFI
jgi:hypothetical protein